MAARRLNPYRQGRLDGLCGVYALINALRLLCPRLDEDACERAFCALIRARARQTSSPLTVISGGLSQRELLRLLGPWQRFAATEFGITLAVSRLKVAEPQAYARFGGACVAPSMARASPSSAWTARSAIGRWRMPPPSGPCG